MLLDREFLMTLRQIRKDSIDVKTAIQIITSATLSAKIRPVKNKSEIGVTVETARFYDTVVRDFCEEYIANIACYGLVVYYVDPEGYPYVIDICDCDIDISLSLSHRVTAKPRQHIDLKLNVFVSEQPDHVTSRCGGALAMCYCNSLWLKKLWVTQMAIITGNGQSIYTLNHTSTARQSDLITAVNTYNCNSYSGFNNNPVNPHGPSAELKDKAYDQITWRSMAGDSDICKDLTSRSQLIHQTVSGDNSRAVAFIPIPLGYKAEQRGYVPELTTVTSMSTALSQAILQAFGVDAIRSSTTLKNSSLYHSSTEVSKHEDAVRALSNRYAVMLIEPFAEIYNRVEKHLKTRVKIRDSIEHGKDATEAVTAAISEVHGTELKILPRASYQQMTAMFTENIITWKSMRTYIAEQCEFVKETDLQISDPRMIEAAPAHTDKKPKLTSGAAPPKHDLTSNETTKTYSSEQNDPRTDKSDVSHK